MCVFAVVIILSKFDDRAPMRGTCTYEFSSFPKSEFAQGFRDCKKLKHDERTSQNCRNLAFVEPSIARSWFKIDYWLPLIAAAFGLRVKNGSIFFLLRFWIPILIVKRAAAAIGMRQLDQITAKVPGDLFRLREKPLERVLRINKEGTKERRKGKIIWGSLTRNRRCPGSSWRILRRFRRDSENMTPSLKEKITWILRSNVQYQCLVGVSLDCGSILLITRLYTISTRAMII